MCLRGRRGVVGGARPRGGAVDRGGKRAPHLGRAHRSRRVRVVRPPGRGHTGNRRLGADPDDPARRQGSRSRPSPSGSRGCSPAPGSVSSASAKNRSPNRKHSASVPSSSTRGAGSATGCSPAPSITRSIWASSHGRIVSSQRLIATPACQSKATAPTNIRIGRWPAPAFSRKSTSVPPPRFAGPLRSTRTARSPMGRWERYSHGLANTTPPSREMSVRSASIPATRQSSSSFRFGARPLSCWPPPQGTWLRQPGHSNTADMVAGPVRLLSQPHRTRPGARCATHH